MALRTNVVRKAGHPWDGNSRPGFDHLYLEADTEQELNKAVESAKLKFWEPWLIGINEVTNLPGGIMYKPCGISEPWDDDPKKPHPGIVVT